MDATLERLSVRLLTGGVPPSLLVDLLDPVGMEHALIAELAELEAARTLTQTVVPDRAADVRTA